MKTLTVLRFFGGGRGAKARIARALGISPAAVSKWPADGEVPAGSAHRLSLLYPQLYEQARAAAPPALPTPRGRPVSALQLDLQLELLRG
ncbi:hypothetical protein SAMN02745857_04272 [Andreprevotia lacus DSM 23236]|jgi:hypothetical protein|uniref:Uncharacterized protein n=1 Tax=Andreprevotia lacus DSM 23236 TaxID=1121001 RepID=A0A1W1Y166_9NEIS|nr:hypothetical protein [Andreprevotia lacus]SMC29929.1 hypothetical protein SAMN02745857_04272 [Andreprevotia lacus DSM 23236]